MYQWTTVLGRIITREVFAICGHAEALHCATLCHTEAHWGTLRYTEAHWGTLRHTEVHLGTLYCVHCEFTLCGSHKYFPWPWIIFPTTETAKLSLTVRIIMRRRKAILKSTKNTQKVLESPQAFPKHRHCNDLHKAAHDNDSTDSAQDDGWRIRLRNVQMIFNSALPGIWTSPSFHVLQTVSFVEKLFQN